jgi:hypothetical protein
LERDQHLKELQLNHEEQKTTTMLLQKMVERLCPEDDPATKLNQLKEEFVKRAAL